MSALPRLTVAALFAAVVSPITIAGTAIADNADELFFTEYIEGTSNNKALEIYNGTASPINLATDSYNVQMFFNGSVTAGLTINLTGSVAPGDVYVVAQASANATILAQADQTNGSGWFNGDDAVVLRKGTTVIDSIGQVGFDPGTEWGTGLASTADNTLRRNSDACAGDTNATDVFDPTVGWTAFATDTFDGLGSHVGCVPPPELAPTVASTTPNGGAGGVATDANVTVTFSEPVGLGAEPAKIECPDARGFTISGGPTTFVLDPIDDFGFGETCTVTVVAAQVADVDGDDPPDTMAADHVFQFTTELAPIAIHEIQQAEHMSTRDGTAVTTTGIVTARRSNGIYIQTPDADVDGSTATSEGIFVFTSSAPGAAITVGAAVEVRGTVSEFRAGGNVATNASLTVTEIVSPTIEVLTTGNTLPAATVVGAGGRVPPTEVIDDDATGSVETSGSFDPDTDGIDFYESLESMLVRVSNPLAVGPTNAFGEIFVVADGGAGATSRTVRGGVVATSADFNPERIQFDDTLLANATPNVNVGDTFTTSAIGVLDYSFGNYEVNLTAPLTRVDNGLQRQSATTADPGELAVATFNVENLDPGDSPATFAALAGQIVDNLGAPDIVALEEIQDNSGPTSDGIVAADQTLDLLVAAITTAGGPSYEWRQIDPVDLQDGGEPGGNIRVGFLFRIDHGLEFVDRPGGTSTSTTTIIDGPNGPQLSASPGRVDPSNAVAWGSSRKPLAGEFTYQGETVFVVVNHFASKGGDQPLFGRYQPPVRSSEVRRHEQAAVVNEFVDQILAVDGGANVVVLGDINDFDFSETVEILKGDALHNLFDTLPPDERYSYVFEGNSQVLDQILVSQSLSVANPSYDPVHVNAEFFDQLSDHDPSVTLIDFDKVWEFGGLQAPLDDTDAIHVVKAGQGVPVRFSLGGDFGTTVLDGTPTSSPVACDGGAPIGQGEETAAAGASGLQFDAATATYTYVWKTSKVWKGTCRQLTIVLDDGTVATATFRFT